MRPIALILVCLAWPQQAPAPAVPGEPARGPALERLAREAGVEVVVAKAEFRVATPFGPITGLAAGEPAGKYAALFAEEFGVYPAAFLRRSGPRRVVFCSGLAFDGQLRGAIPDFWNDALFLDVARGAYSPAYQRTAIHHEFFHIVDFRDDGEVYSDDAWAALNPPDFRYGPGGRNVQGDARGSLPADDLPGFLTSYATAGVEEDKAEVFSRLVVSPREVARRAGKDAVLAAKVARMKAGLKAFDASVDDAFWKRLEARPPVTIEASRPAPGEKPAG